MLSDYLKPSFVLPLLTDAAKATIKELQVAAHATARRRGEYEPYLDGRGYPKLTTDRARLFVVTIMHQLSKTLMRPDLVSSASSTEYAHRSIGMRGTINPRTDYAQGWEQSGTGAELAKAVVMIFDLARALGIDLGEAIDAELQASFYRTEHRWTPKT